MSHALNLHDGSGIIATDPSLGILLAYGSTVPAAATVGYAPGAQFLKTNGTTIGTVTYVNVGTRASASFVQAGTAGGIVVNYVYGEVLPIDSVFFVADRNYTVTSVMVRPLVAGDDVSAVTAVVRKVVTTAAISTGAGLHSGNINLKGTADVNQSMTLAAAANIAVAAGYAIGLDVTGTATNARGVVTIGLQPT